MMIFMGVGLVLWAKWLMPEEEVVQDRHDEPSTEEDKLMTQATLAVGLQDTGLPRRSLILRSLGLAGGAIATVPLVALVGAMIKKPGKQLDHTLFAPNPKLFPPNGRVPIVYSDWRRVSPDDMLPGGIATVFPGVRQDGPDGKDGVTSASSPTLIIRLRPGPEGQAAQGPGRLRLAGRRPGVRRVLQDLHARRLPGLAVRAADLPPAVPVPPVAVRGARGREAGVRPGDPQPAEAADRRRDRFRRPAVLRRDVRLPRSRSARRFWERS